jgi:bacterioferritin
MGHIEKRAERILFLKGEVQMEAAGKVQPIVEPADILGRAAEMEQQSARDYNKSTLECSANADAASKQIFEALVQDEEAHFEAFDQQLENIKRFGPSYLALQSFAAKAE